MAPSGGNVRASQLAEDRHRAGQRGNRHQERRNLTDGRLDMDVGGAPLNQANLRDNPKQLTIRVGNISLFYPMTTTSSNRFLALDKKTYVGGPALLAALAGRRHRGEAPPAQAVSQIRNVLPT